MTGNSIVLDSRHTLEVGDRRFAVSSIAALPKVTRYWPHAGTREQQRRQRQMAKETAKGLALDEGLEAISRRIPEVLMKTIRDQARWFREKPHAGLELVPELINADPGAAPAVVREKRLALAEAGRRFEPAPIVRQLDLLALEIALTPGEIEP